MGFARRGGAVHGPSGRQSAPRVLSLPPFSFSLLPLPFLSLSPLCSLPSLCVPSALCLGVDILFSYVR